MSLRPLFVVAGIGNATGTGAAAARLFAKSGYSVALVSRFPFRDGNDTTSDLAREITLSSGQATGFTIASYAPSSLASAFQRIASAYPPSQFALRAALWNAGHPVFKPFLDTTEADVEESMNTNVLGAFAFARHAILGMRGNASDEATGKGTLIFTGATASLRGNTRTSAFSAAKSGVRALSQSLAKEFGPKEDIHVAHVIIDGLIMTGNALGGKMNGLRPDSIAQAHLDLTRQEKSAWTWELDLRPASEQW